MKKILLVVSVFVVAVAIFGLGIVFAQQTQPALAAGYAGGYGQGMMGGRGGFGGGAMRTYVEQALADKLGMTLADVDTALASGKSMYQIALDKGIADADVPALLAEVHKTAFDKAVADGVMSQAQADLMYQNMSANGFTAANCAMNGGAGYGRGGGRGRGGMMGGWGYQQQQSQP
jgi:hypothetical protein